MTVALRPQIEGYGGTVQASARTVRCPVCHHQGTLEAFAQDQHFMTLLHGSYAAGVRRCPNPACRTLLHVEYSLSNQGEGRVFPPEALDYDATNLPDAVLAAFEEAVKCHSIECYTASIIMVRKTLEEVCAEQKVNGSTLKERLGALAGKVTLPPDLITILDDLRLLGNDAAHIELKTFTAVSAEEAEVAIQAVKEILKALYQLADLLSKMRALRRSPDA